MVRAFQSDGMAMKSLFTAAATMAIVCAAAVVSPALADVPSLETPHYGTWGFDVSGMDPKVKPGDDFFRYANGAYLERTTIPSDRTRFGNFDVLSSLSEARVRAILDEASAKAEPVSTPAGKIGRFYRAFMDQPKVEALGTKPLEKDLSAVRAVKTHADLARLSGRVDGFRRELFVSYITPDQKDPDHYAVGFSSSGLGLPDKDYYLKPAFAEKKAAYQAYAAKMLGLIGWPEAEARAADIVAFETKLAEASWDRAERRDRDKTYNPMTPAELAAYAPGFDFKAYLTARDLGEVKRVVVSDNTAFPKKAKIFAETPIETLKAWEALGVVDQAAPYLPDRFVQAHFEFHGKTLSGQPELRPRWKRAVAATDGVLGEAVGEVYVARYFPPEAKRQMLDLVGNIRSALAARIQRLDWMSPETKTQALDKLGKISLKIGYPDKFRDYSALSVRADDLYGNVIRGEEFEYRRELARLYKPVDRSEWGMTPQTVNAYYNPVLNEIVFPAAILQPPFFDPKADPAVNYGGIGGVIGHEISHGFDDQGRKSDGSGRLHDWWTADDAAKFKAKTKALGAQYSAMEMLPGEHINGDLTMGENIGDMGGLNIALEAYHNSLKGQPAPVIDGFTGDQRVFLGWAQVWRQKIRDEALRQQLHTDPHSPAEARVDGVVRNMDVWYSAFDVKPGEKLYVAPTDRVHIW
jgi:putative endopeptidase